MGPFFPIAKFIGALKMNVAVWNLNDPPGKRFTA